MFCASCIEPGAQDQFMPFCSVPSFGLDQLLGFTSFLLDEEDKIWVAYCFELHVADNQQRKGFGQLLLKVCRAT